MDKGKSNAIEPPTLTDLSENENQHEQQRNGSRYPYGSISSDSSIRLFASTDPEEPKSPASNPPEHPYDGVRFRYLAYYFPFLKWMPQYRWTWLRGDGIAALTVASLYVPMCFSFSIIGHVDPISGLYAFIVHPFLYALLGSSPLMVVGPEATGSLMVGTLINQINSNGRITDTYDNAVISGVATALAGAMLLGAGLGRIGFLDSVLNRPFMQGLIAGVGFVLVVEQAVLELGLSDLVRENGVAQSSAMAKLGFILVHLPQTHALTAALAIPSLGFILAFRSIQRRTRSKWPSISLFPDRLVILTITTLLTWKLGLAERGVEILGSLGSSDMIPTMRWPFQSVDEIEMVFTTSVLIALLGFFESSVTAKSLKPVEDGPQDIMLSANRELIALGTANMVGGCFTTLPAFGGFGRSKLNQQTGATTPMSSILLSFITLLSVFCVLPYLHFVPKPVLSAMASVVGISMMEECPHDIKFFLKVKGWRELSLIALVFFATAFYSMSLGIVIGIVLSLFRLIQHSTMSRIQILGRVPGSRTAFEDAEVAPHGDQFEQCLIVRIPEPLTFANVGDLRTRLRRFQRYGRNAAHPSLPRSRLEDRCLIFDVHGLTDIDACAMQAMANVVQEHTSKGTQVIFCRLRPTKVLQSFQRSGVIDACGGIEHFVDSVEAALQMAGMAL